LRAGSQGERPHDRAARGVEHGEDIVARPDEDMAAGRIRGDVPDVRAGLNPHGRRAQQAPVARVQDAHGSIIGVGDEEPPLRLGHDGQRRKQAHGDRAQHG